MRGSHVITALMMIAGCGFNPSGGQVGDDDTIDPDGGGPDDDGSPGDGACVEGCDGFDLVTCTGGQEMRTACSAGCLDTGGAHCATLVPSNGADASDLVDVTGDLVVNTGEIVVVDTDDGSIVAYSGGGQPTTIRDPGNGLGDMIRFRTLAQTGGAPTLGIFGVRRMMIADGGRLRIVGDRPVLFLLAAEATIGGVIDVAAGHMGDTGSVDCQDCPGPGGGAGGTSLTAASGCAPGVNGQYSATLDETGGGGGGFGSMGARGGDSDNGTALGGDVTALTACSGPSLIPLQGGSGGGRSSGTVTFGNEVGGAGGGAVQITAMTSISITTTGDIYAAGAGGDGSTDDYGGAGGGAGGGILLESPSIMIATSARITANGGGGGSGREANRGENGARGAVRASGGAGSGTTGDEGRGGLGSIGAATNQAATQGGGSIDGTGGGGGGAGIIRFNSVAPLLVPSGVILSPAPSMGQPQRQ